MFVFNKDSFVTQQKLSEIFRENLKRLRGDASQEDFARKLGFKSQQAYAYYEDAPSVPKEEILAQIAEKLGVSTINLLLPHKIDSEGNLVPFYKEDVRMVPLISFVQAGSIENLSQCYEDLCEQIDRKVATASKDPNALGLIVAGDSMMPDFLPGDWVIVEPNAEPQHKQAVVVKLKDGRVLLKYWTRSGEDGRTILLISRNSAKYPPFAIHEDDFVFKYPVVDLHRKPPSLSDEALRPESGSPPSGPST